MFKLNGLHKPMPKMVVESVFVIEFGVSPVIQVVDVSEEVGDSAIPKHDGNEVPLVAVWGGEGGGRGTTIQICRIGAHLTCIVHHHNHTHPPPHPTQAKATSNNAGSTKLQHSLTR